MMARPKKSQKSDTVIRFLTMKHEVVQFRKRAAAEGFGENLSAWILWHLRKVVRESDERPGV
jgi:hypothetical protein